MALLWKYTGIKYNYDTKHQIYEGEEANYNFWCRPAGCALLGTNERLHERTARV